MEATSNVTGTVLVNFTEYVTLNSRNHGPILPAVRLGNEYYTVLPPTTTGIIEYSAMVRSSHKNKKCGVNIT